MEAGGLPHSVTLNQTSQGEVDRRDRMKTREWTLSYDISNTPEAQLLRGTVDRKMSQFIHDNGGSHVGCERTPPPGAVATRIRL